MKMKMMMMMMMMMMIMMMMMMNHGIFRIRILRHPRVDHVGLDSTPWDHVFHSR